MKYVVLLYQDESVWDAATPAEQQSFLDRHDRFDRAVPERGCTVLAGEALTPVTTATTVRRRGERIGITDGPFAETVEQLGGFYVVDAPDLDTLVDLVALLPEYTIEIRPIAEG